MKIVLARALPLVWAFLCACSLKNVEASWRLGETKGTADGAGVVASGGIEKLDTDTVTGGLRHGSNKGGGGDGDASGGGGLEGVEVSTEQMGNHQGARRRRLQRKRRLQATSVEGHQLLDLRGAKVTVGNVVFPRYIARNHPTGVVNGNSDANSWTWGSVEIQPWGETEQLGSGCNQTCVDMLASGALGCDHPEMAPWVQIDMLSVAELSAVTLYHLYAYGAWKHCNQKVELSLDGENWQTVYDTGAEYGPGETFQGNTIYFNPVIARYIRHTAGRHAGGHLVVFLEIDAIGTKDIHRIAAENSMLDLSGAVVSGYCPNGWFLPNWDWGPTNNVSQDRVDTLIDGDLSFPAPNKFIGRVGESCDDPEGACSFQVDIGYKASISGVVLYAEWNGKARVCNQKVEISADGDSWISVYDTGTSYGPIETSDGNTILFQPTVARYVKYYAGGGWGVYGDDTYSNTVKPLEIKVIGSLTLNGEDLLNAKIIEHVVTGERLFARRTTEADVTHHFGLGTPMESRPYRTAYHWNFKQVPCEANNCVRIVNVGSSRQLTADSNATRPDGVSALFTLSGSQESEWHMVEAECLTSDCVAFVNVANGRELSVNGSSVTADIVPSETNRTESNMWRILSSDIPSCNQHTTFRSATYGKEYCHDPSFLGDFESMAYACRKAGYAMASILSKGEHEFLLRNAEWDQLPDDAKLYTSSAWIGLVENYGSNELKWLSGEGALFTAPLDSSYSPTPSSISTDCFVMTHEGTWLPKKCHSTSTANQASALCQRQLEDTSMLQEAFFAFNPSGKVYMFQFGYKKFLTTHVETPSAYPDNDKVVTIAGKPGGRDRFRFIKDDTGFGVQIQASTVDAKGIPTFLDGKNFWGIDYNGVSFVKTPTLVDQASAAVFIINSDTKKYTPGFGLRLKFDPNIFFTVNQVGQVEYRDSPEPAKRFMLNFIGAPDKYKMIVVLDEIDFSKQLQQGSLEFAVAAERIIESTAGETSFDIKLSSEQTEEMTVLSSESQMRESFSSSSDSNSVGIGASVTVGASASVDGLVASATVSAEATVSADTSFETSVETGSTWQKATTSENGFSQSRTQSITDTLSLVVPAGKMYKASLIIATKRVKDVSTMATARLYADDTLIATARFAVKINAMAVSSGTIKVESYNASRRELLLLERPVKMKSSDRDDGIF